MPGKKNTCRFKNICENVILDRGGWGFKNIFFKNRIFHPILLQLNL